MTTANDGGVFPPSPLTLKQRSFVRQCVDVIIAVAQIYGFDDTGFSRKGTYDHWIYAAAVYGDAMGYVKWKISAYYSYHKDQEIPQSRALLVDHAGIVLSGRGYTFLQKMKNQMPIDFESFVLSILFSKKGMPRPGKEELKLAEQEAFEKLTKPALLQPEFLAPWGDQDRTHKSLESLLSKQTLSNQIHRTVFELYRGVKMSDDDWIRPFFPSTSANYINTRSMGGVVGHILDHPDLLEGLKSEDKLIELKQLGTSRSLRYAVDSSRLRENFSKLYKRMFHEALVEEPLVTPLALPEALKKRVISKGPPMLNTVLKPLQRKLWSVLKSHPCFKLTGTPVTGDLVQERMGAKLGPGQKFLSVDYKDATNEMHSWCSNATADALEDVLSLDSGYGELLKRSLTGHEIEYNGVIKSQTRGQLMGEITSFPVLCIVNAAICRWTLEIAHNRVYTLRDCPLTVNGDDAILRTNDAGRHLWAKIASFCGLSPSVGKVYWSDKFLNINSTTYNYHSDGYEGYTILREGKQIHRLRHFELVNYVNMGLLYNLKRSGDKAGLEGDDKASFGARATALINTVPWFLRERVLGQFIHLNSSLLCSARVPWFIPESLGGLGLPILPGFKPKSIDLRIARKIYEHRDVYKLPSKPIDAPWRVWQYAQKRFPVIPTATMANDFGGFYNTPEVTPMTNEQQLFALTCVEAIFRVRGLKDLYDAKESFNTNALYLKRLSKIWKKAIKDTKIAIPEPFNPENFPIVYNSTRLPIFQSIEIAPHYY